MLSILVAGFGWLPSALRWPVRVIGWGMVVWLVIRVVRRWRRSPPTPRGLAFVTAAAALGLLLAYLAAEGGAWGLIRLRPQYGSPRLELTTVQRRAVEQALAGATPYTRLDARLGWVNQANAVSADGLARTNADAVRADRDYPTALGNVRERVLTFGDSFTHGTNVANDETWQHHAEQARPGLEMLNFGVGGYGMTQALLRFETEVGRYEATGVILGCMTDDLRRSLNAYYPFRFRPPSLAPSASGAPHAVLDAAGRLEIRPNPLADPASYRALLDRPADALTRLARIEPLYPSPGATPLLDLVSVSRQTYPDGWDRALRWLPGRAGDFFLGRKPDRPSRQRAVPGIYEAGNLVFETNLQIFERFHRGARDRGLVPLILWFPSPKDVAARAGGRERAVYAAYLEALAARDIETIDVLAWIEADFGGPGRWDASSLFVGGHYAPAVNAAIGRRLAARSWLPTGGVR